MTKQNLPAVSDLTKETLEEFKTADKVVLVAYFAADDKASNETFTSVANGLRDNYLFGAINDAAVAEAEGVKQPAIVLYKSFDDGKDTFTEKFDKAAIESFAKVASTPLVGEVGPETYSGYIAVSCFLTTTQRSKLTSLSRLVSPSHTSSPRPRRSVMSSPRS
jgi:protein disulfide-isomerase A1